MYTSTCAQRGLPRMLFRTDAPSTFGMFSKDHQVRNPRSRLIDPGLIAIGEHREFTVDRIADRPPGDQEVGLIIFQNKNVKAPITAPPPRSMYRNIVAYLCSTQQARSCHSSPFSSRKARIRGPIPRNSSYETGFRK